MTYVSVGYSMGVMVTREEVSMSNREIMRLRRLVETGAAKAIRLDAEISLGELSDDSKVGRSTIHKWEQGLRRPRRSEAAIRYLKALDELAGR